MMATMTTIAMMVTLMTIIMVDIEEDDGSRYGYGIVVDEG